MFDALEHKAKSAARTVALSAAGAVSLCVGLGFLTVAAWIYLSTVADTLTAAGVIGAVYAGVGLVTIGLSSGRKPQAVATSHNVAAHRPQPPLMQAFLHGMQAGATAQRR